MKIWANTIVNNEENFIWFSIMSVVDFVDKVLIYDTGSEDKTVEIIKEIKKIKGNKIDFKEVGLADKFQFPKIRQKMLNQSECDWILILDGDEIWWEDSIKKIVKEINDRGNQVDGVVVPMIVPVGDIYHFQEEKAGRYNLLGRTGHLSLRLINRRIPGLHTDYPYGKESFLDGNNKLVQEREKIIFLDAPYLHVTHLKRSAKLRKFDKFKYELGNKPTKNFKYPEVFYKERPKIVSSPWKRRSRLYKIISLIKVPFIKFSRNLKR